LTNLEILSLVARKARDIGETNTGAAVVARLL